MKTVPLNSLKAVLKNEVFPALGCTEPIAVAYAASVAANEIDGGPEKIVITAEETIRNPSKVSAIGMATVDDRILAIMKKKTP